MLWKKGLSLFLFVAAALLMPTAVNQCSKHVTPTILADGGAPPPPPIPYPKLSALKG
jgi:hypothetical protein